MIYRRRTDRGHHIYLFILFKIVSSCDGIGVIRVYNESNQLIKSFQAHKSSIIRVEQLQNGYMASISNDFKVKIWDATNNNWNLIRNYSSHTGAVQDIEYINGDTVATASSDRTIKIWSIKTGITNTIRIFLY